MRGRLQPYGKPPPARLSAARPAALLPPAESVENSVLRTILERIEGGSAPGDRNDGHIVCLAIEGGGMRGAVSAGMCVVLEAAGLISAFDRVYGVSAGALNGCATAAGQAALSATHYVDAASRRVINRMRPLVRQPVVDFDLLFEDVISARKPLSFEALAAGPEFRCLATSVETLTLRVLGNFAHAEDLVQAVRASAAFPRLGGSPPLFRGEEMIDGALIEPIPFETALAEGATHVLALRSRPARYRKSAFGGLGESLAFRDSPGLVKLVRAGHTTYNRQASRLASAATLSDDAHLLQVAVPDDARTIARLEGNADRVTEAVALGARAMASVILDEPIDLCWQPMVYRATPMKGAHPASTPWVLRGLPSQPAAARAAR